MRCPVSIVTPWLDHAELIADYEAAVRGSAAQVIVVDNGSTAAVAVALEEMVGRLEGVYVRNEENRWFSRANNQGLALAAGDVIVFLNSDVAGEPGWLAAVAADVGPRVLAGPSVLNCAVDGTPVRYVEGWCVAARREVWAELGGWDERTYPMPYWEDADLSARAAVSGIALARTNWKVFHKGGATARDVPAIQDGFRRNRRAFLNRAGASAAAAESAVDKITMAMAEDGRLPEALEACRLAAAADPNDADALHLLGYLSHRAGRHEAALELLNRSISLRPSSAVFHSNLGGVLAKLRRLDEATRELELAARLAPDSPSALANLGTALQECGRPDRAVPVLREALRLRPDDPAALISLSAALRQRGAADKAVAHARRAAALAPSLPQSQNAVGLALQAIGDGPGAVAAFERAVSLSPEYVEAHLNLGLALLRVGAFERGWQAYELRWRARGAEPRRHASRPLWDGSPLVGRSILLHAEQGFGTTIQFARYAPLLARGGAQVFVECQPELRRLFETLDGVAGVTERGATGSPAFDTQLPIASAALRFGTTSESIPAEVPYLHVAPEALAAWRGRVADRAGNTLKVGLAWAGGLGSAGDPRRLPADLVAKLTAVPGVSWFNLAKAADGNLSGGTSPPRTIDWTDELADFADTAALVANLDLVVSVDTSVAHLAGAMGRAVWTLLPFDADWRWMSGRSNSPWYPSMRLFRQPTPGDWNGVIDAVATALREAAGESPGEAL